MEDVLDLYAEPDDPRDPPVCFDESPVQLTSETRHPLPARHDSEYTREGTANLFLLVQPFGEQPEHRGSLLHVRCFHPLAPGNVSLSWGPGNTWRR